MIAQRKRPDKKNKQCREVNQVIKKAIREHKRMRYNQKNEGIVEEHKDLKSIPSEKTQEKEGAAIVHENTRQQGHCKYIREVYGKLYHSETARKIDM